MTREEAITLINSAKLMLINPSTNEPVSDLYEALDMAISALEQMPETTTNNDEPIYINYPIITCEDAIRIADAKKLYCYEICTVGVNCKDIPTLSCNILKKFDDLPSVTPSRQNIPKGKTARCIGCRFLKECCAEMVEK